VPTSSLSPPASLAIASPSANIFAQIAINVPPQNIAFRSDHPAQAVGLVPQNSPLHTNKFYANMFLGTQNSAVWTHPYSISWAKGGGNTRSWGFSVLHIERDRIAYGQANSPSGAPQYFVNPIGIQAFVLSAAELGNATVLTTDSHKAFSVNANLAPSSGASPIMSAPFVQGMGFVTAVYNQATVLLQSGVFFRSISTVGSLNNDATFKYQIVLEDNSNWLLYVTPNGAAGTPPFILQDSTTIRGPKGFQGTVQIAKNPAGTEGEASYDSAAGAYPISASIAGSAKDSLGSYDITWNKAGQMGQSLLMFALPHHRESFVPELQSCATKIQLTTTTKGLATAYLADSFKFSEPDLPVGIGFDPWSPTRRKVKAVSSTAAQHINAAAGVELAQDMEQQSNLNSMYYSGKVSTRH
jgi:endo-1,3(4)-beta-glucanase